MAKADLSSKANNVGIQTEGNAELIGRDVKNIEGSTTVIDTYSVTPVVISEEGIMPFTDSSTTETNRYWRAEIQIKYTVDATYACLETVSGKWVYLNQGGSNTITNGQISYGQILGTNSRNGSSITGISCYIPTGFSKGKYGSGHSLGANMSATVGGEKLEAAINIGL